MHDDLRNTLDAVVDLLNRYVVLPDAGAETVALYAQCTHLVDVATFAPMLVLKSPEMRCGKTTTMDLIGEVVRDPLGAANASAAVLYRAVDERKPTLMLDEVDAFLAQKSEASEAVRGILNAGHRRGRFSRVLRLEASGKSFEMREFDVFGFKVLSGIGHLHGTLTDRAIVLTLRRKRRDEQVARLRIAQIEPETEALRERLQTVATEIQDAVAVALPDIPTALSDRAADNWEMLMAVADIAGGRWPAVARNAAMQFSAGDEADSARVLLLRDIRDYFDEVERDTAPTGDLLAHLNDMETRPWSTWHRDEKPMDPRDLAKALSHFDIGPHQFKLGAQKTRGYRRDDFADAWARYLWSETDGTPVPDADNSLQEQELEPERQSTGYRMSRYHNDEGTGQYRYPENDRNRYNSIQDKELDAIGTVVPDESGPDQDEEVDIDIF